MPPQISKYTAAQDLMQYVGDSGRDFTEDQWYEFCEARRSLIARYMRSHTLKTLDNLECRVVYGRPKELGDCELEGWQSGIASEFQGIFGRGRRYHLETSETHYPDGSRWAFGLARRSSQWVVIGIVLRSNMIHDNQEQVIVERAKVRAVTLPELCETAEVHPKQVFELLGHEVERWFADKTRQYNKVMKLAHLVSAQDLVLMARMSGGVEAADVGDEAVPGDSTEVEGSDIDLEGTAEL